MAKTYNIIPSRGNFFQRASLILKGIKVFLPSTLLLIVFSICLILLPQGSDLLTKTSENQHWYPGILVLVGLFFWSYVIWYTGRIIAYFQKGMYQQMPGMMFHFPRISGFYVYMMFIIAFLGKPGLWSAQYLNSLSIFVLLVLSGVYYWLLNVGIKRGSVVFIKRFGFALFTKIYHWLFVVNILLIIAFGLIRNSNYTMILAALIMQALFMFLVANRKRVNELSAPLKVRDASRFILTRIFGSAQQRIPRYEDLTFIVLNIFAAVAVIVFIMSVFWMDFSIGFGTLGVILLAFSFYTGLFNLLRVLSWVYKVNLVFFIVLSLFIGSMINETHKVYLRDEAGTDYDERIIFRTYAIEWLGQHERALLDDSVAVVPMVFVHSDGGASRSGYWVASVLGRLDSLSQGYFSEQLFVLSGASGGSLGNTTFYALLKKSIEQGVPRYDLTQQAKSFLKTDFLTFTVSRMLGSEISNYILPFTDDRARTLERSLETGMSKKDSLYGYFAQGFASFNELKVKERLLPILCINTTRMQDGKPGIVSNVCMDSTIYGNRVDVLSLIPKGKDLNISSAVILGARFPYLSPAGRIDEVLVQDNKQEIRKHYFVDGGYFDNSGAGVVHEMIMELQKLFETDFYIKTRYGAALQKIRFTVVHVYNTPKSAEHFKKTQPIINDLAAPLITLAGSYSSQTSVNDSRLKIFIENLYNTDSLIKSYGLKNNYHEINLYQEDPPEVAEDYTMNWVISQATLSRMDKRREENQAIAELARVLNVWKGKGR